MSKCFKGVYLVFFRQVDISNKPLTTKSWLISNFWSLHCVGLARSVLFSDCEKCMNITVVGRTLFPRWWTRFHWYNCGVCMSISLLIINILIVVLQTIHKTGFDIGDWNLGGDTLSQLLIKHREGSKTMLLPRNSSLPIADVDSQKL